MWCQALHKWTDCRDVCKGAVRPSLCKQRDCRGVLCTVQYNNAVSSSSSQFLTHYTTAQCHWSVQDEGLWSVSRAVVSVSVQGCGQCPGLWSVSRAVVSVSVQGCGQCSGLWSVSRAVVSVQGSGLWSVSRAEGTSWLRRDRPVVHTQLTQLNVYSYTSHTMRSHLRGLQQIF